MLGAAIDGFLQVSPAWASKSGLWEFVSTEGACPDRNP